MSNRIETDLLAEQADELIDGRRDVTLPQDVDAAQLATLQTLMNLAERTRDALAPVQPSPLFVRQLGKQLVTTASANRSKVARRTRNVILLMAEALGSAVILASAVGVALYLIRHRGQRTLSRS